MKKSIFGGILISIGGFTYVSTGLQFIGAIMFAFGLICVVLTGSKLFTGKSGFCDNKKEYLELASILFFNAIGCIIIGYIAHNSIDTTTIIEKRFNSYWLDVLLLSICTGMIMTISVKYAKFDNKWLPLLFGVPTFIICGMPHCIADAFYYSVYLFDNGIYCIKNILPVWGLSIIGNFIGCIAPTKLFKIQ